MLKLKLYRFKNRDRTLRRKEDEDEYVNWEVYQNDDGKLYIKTEKGVYEVVK